MLKWQNVRMTWEQLNHRQNGKGTAHDLLLSVGIHFDKIQNTEKTETCKKRKQKLTNIEKVLMKEERKSFEKLNEKGL